MPDKPQTSSVAIRLLAVFVSRFSLAGNLRMRLVLFAFSIALTSAFAATPFAPAIRLNSIGFLPSQPKHASIVSQATNFSVIRLSEGGTVFSGVLTGANTNADTGERLFTADFSALTNAGTYQLEVPGAGRSAPFRISGDVYHDAFVTVTRAMYLWRCGTAVSGMHNGKTFSHAACHTNDAWLISTNGTLVRSDSTGGWHDAGDYNKYVVNAGVTVGCMFRAWEDFQPAIQRLELRLPEHGGALPEYLAEIKWELDWLLTMQSTDGLVHHKVSTREFGDFIPPENEATTRYITPWSSAATADFVALFAAAARHFRPFDPAYAARCLATAEKSQRFLTAHPENRRADLTGFSTGDYQTHDEDDRLWATAELWATTGDTNHLRDFEQRAVNFGRNFEAVWDWGNVCNLGFLTYLSASHEGRNPELVESLRAKLLLTADGIVRTRDEHGYARPLGPRYYWGCNGTVARQTLLLQAAYRLSGKPAYRHAALDAVGNLFGRNPFGRSFVTGLGANPPQHPHDRRSGDDGMGAPWPGYLVGGPNLNATDWLDEQKDFRTNEIAINWNAALIYALAGFLEDADR